MTTTMLTLVNSSLLLGLRELEADTAWDLSPLLVEHGIDRTALGNSEGSVSLSSFIELLQDCARIFDCPHLALEVARRRPAQDFGVITHLLKVSPDVAYALSHGNRYARLLNPTRNWVIEEQGDNAIITRVDNSGYSGPMEQYLALTIAQYFKLLQSLCGPGWRANLVTFTFSPIGKTTKYKRYFDSNIQFESNANTIRFPRHYLRKKIPTYDAGILQIVEAHIEELANMQPKTTKEEVEFMVKLMIGNPECSLQNIAQRLGIHSKALQRKLKEEKTTFREVLLEARMSYAQTYLGNSDLQINEVAALLGYSSSPALSRSFKKQFGLSPDDWRSLHKQD